MLTNLTQAAHCLDDIVAIEIRAGVSTLVQMPQYHQVVEARDTRQHEQYNPDSLLNDIGLIFVRRRIPMTELVRPIALPRRSQANNKFIGDVTTIIGWGKWGNECELMRSSIKVIAHVRNYSQLSKNCRTIFAL